MSILVSAILLLSSSINVFATDNTISCTDTVLSVTSTAKVIPDKSLDATVNSLIQAKGSNLVINEKIPLYDADQNIIAWGYSLSPTGYVIIDINNNIVEYSIQNGAPFTSNEKTYFTGPLDYYTKENSDFVNTVSDEKITEKTFELDSEDFCTITKSISNNTKSDLFRKNNCSFKDTLNLSYHKSGNKSYSVQTHTDGPVVYTDYKIPFNLRAGYTNNEYGSCPSIAAGILLMYYCDRIDSYIVPSWLITYDGAQLTKKLSPHIEGSGGNAADVASGLNWYFRWRGISNKYSASYIWQSPGSTTVFSKIKSYIRKDRPIQVGINGHPTYTSHMVVANGYETATMSGSVYNSSVIVNDGWGNNDVFISTMYVDACVYINE